MNVSHAAAAVDVAFDDPNLIADAGLVPVLALAEQIGLPELVAEHVAISGAANGAGASPAAKVMSLPAGMVAGQTRLRTWTGCDTPVTGWCSTRSGLPRRWHVSARVHLRACAAAQCGAASESDRQYVPRSRHHRHHPCSPDQRPRPARPLGPPPDPAHAPAMALGTGLGQPPRRDPPTPTTRRLT